MKYALFCLYLFFIHNSLELRLSNTIETVFSKKKQKYFIFHSIWNTHCQKLHMSKWKPFTISYKNKSSTDSVPFYAPAYDLWIEKLQYAIGRAVSSIGSAIENWISYFWHEIEWIFDRLFHTITHFSFLDFFNATGENERVRMKISETFVWIYSWWKNWICIRFCTHTKKRTQKIDMSHFYSYLFIKTYAIMISIFWINSKCTSPIGMHYIFTFFASLNIVFRI